VKISFSVNNEKFTLETDGMRRLLDALREDLHLTGTKEGCGEGECGACSVMVDNELVCSCLLPVCQVEFSSILTIEGLGSPEGGLDPLQQAMVHAHGAQCGICIPGMVMAGWDLRKRLGHENRPAKPGEIRNAISGNLCRCTGYSKIVEAIDFSLATQQEEPNS